MCRQKYSELIKELKGMCKDRLLMECDSAGLSDTQRKVILWRCCYDKGVEETSDEIGMCETCVISHFSVALRKLDDSRKYRLQSDRGRAINE